jgi:hypothetical protein
MHVSFDKTPDKEQPVVAVSKGERKWSRVPLNNKFEVVFEIHRSFLSGGGLNHLAHVTLEIDGEELFRTADQPSPPVWNEKVPIYFSDLLSSIASNITFAVYKKRWTSSGYKLVGTHNIPVSDLLGVVDKSTLEKVDVDLTPNKRNLTLHGNLIFSILVKSIASGNTSTDSSPRPDRIPLPRQSSLSSADRKNRPIAMEGAKSSIFQICYEIFVEDLGDHLRHLLGQAAVMKVFLLLVLLGLLICNYQQRKHCVKSLESLTFETDSLQKALHRFIKTSHS